MKILIVHPQFTEKEARGSEIIAYDTYFLLKKFGHEVLYFATEKQPYIENANFTKYFTKYYSKFSPVFFWNKDAQEKMEKLITENAPDIVHIHGTNIISYSILKPIFKMNIPVVMTVHDAGILCPTRMGWDYSKNKICKICTGFNNFPCILKRCMWNRKLLPCIKFAILNSIEKITRYNKRINKFIVPSQALAKYIASEDIPESKVVVMP